MAFRRGQNVSQFHANLNIINPMYGTAEPPVEDTFDQSNLDLFSNADFFDWDMGQSIQSVVGPETNRQAEKKVDSTSIDVFAGETGLDAFDINAVDFNSLQSYLMSDFNPHQQPSAHIQPVAAPSRPQQQYQRPRNLPILPASPAIAHNISSTFASPVSPASTISHNLKRKSIALDSASSPVESNLEEASRAAAEEDKRRRNTAASARFRVKKKQREQALEHHSKELETKLQELHGRVTTLESENKWLKDLLMEKHGSNEDFLKLIKSAPFPLSSLASNDASDDE